MSIAYGATANYTVDVTLPAGKTVLTGYDTVIRATSANTSTATNDTIDRLYTGFVQLIKSFSISNTTGVGGPTDAVPGAQITYSITYSNISSNGGTGNVQLTATNVVISEDGSASPNNWATYTTQALSPAPSDSRGGTVKDGVTNGAVTGTTNFLKDFAPNLPPQTSGIFSFTRTIN
jgi:hypothetical protein